MIAMRLNIQQRVLLSFLLLVAIGSADYFVSSEISTAAFYLLPIVLFSYQNHFRLRYSVLFGILAGCVWIWVDYHTHAYSTEKYLIINWLFRGALFIGSPIISNRFYLEKEQRLVISEQKAELEKANADLNRFIGMAAHDIRNPVGSIQMMAEILLEDEQIPEDKKNFLGMIHTTAQNSLQILNDTLNISKIQSGTVELNIASADYIKLVNECINLNKPLAEKKQQTIELETEISSVILPFDKSRLSQVLNNLLTNAIKYSELTKPIKVKISYKDAEHTMVLTEVIDRGLGIDEKYHATLFDPFTTTSNKPTDNESKTGLGLSIVKKIVELHKGTIGFTSEKGKGSDFYFTLPIPKS